MSFAGGPGELEPKPVTMPTRLRTSASVIMSVSSVREAIGHGGISPQSFSNTVAQNDREVANIHRL